MNLLEIIKETGELPLRFNLNSGERVVLSICEIPTGGVLLYYHEVISGSIVLHEVGRTKEQAIESMKETIEWMSK
jgi:hypothetical protein